MQDPSVDTHCIPRDNRQCLASTVYAVVVIVDLRLVVTLHYTRRFAKVNENKVGLYQFVYGIVGPY